MSLKLAATLTGIAIAALAPPSFGHHGSNIVYDLTQSVTVTGTVTEFQFVNPHVQLLFDVGGDDGAVVGWLAGLPSTIRLDAEGWTRETLKPGDEVTVTGAPARNGAPSLWVEQILLNGEPLLERKYTG